MSVIEDLTGKVVTCAEIASEAINVALKQSCLDDLHGSMVGAFYDGYIELATALLASVSTLPRDEWNRLIRKAGGQ